MRFEKRITEQLTAMAIPHSTCQILCLCCKGFFRNPTFGVYPQMCERCGILYDRAFQYMMPDVVVHGDRKGIIYVNGTVHERPKVRARDKAQFERIREFGMVPFAITNREIDNMTNMTLRLYLVGVVKALSLPSLYELARLGEKDIWGMYP